VLVFSEVAVCVVKKLAAAGGVIKVQGVHHVS